MIVFIKKSRWDYKDNFDVYQGSLFIARSSKKGDGRVEAIDLLSDRQKCNLFLVDFNRIKMGVKRI